jgi:hypothetical protein
VTLSGLHAPLTRIEPRLEQFGQIASEGDAGVRAVDIVDIYHQ